MSKTNYLEDAVIQYFLRNNADTFSPIATLYVGLATAVTDAEAGTVTEVTGGGYARQTIAFNDPAGVGVTANTSEILFPEAGSNLGTVTHFFIADASTAGNIYYIGALDSSFAYNTAVQPRFAAGAIDITED